MTSRVKKPLSHVCLRVASKDLLGCYFINSWVEAGGNAGYRAQESKTMWVSLASEGLGRML